MHDERRTNVRKVAESKSSTKNKTHRFSDAALKLLEFFRTFILTQRVHVSHQALPVQERLRRGEKGSVSRAETPTKLQLNTRDSSKFQSQRIQSVAYLAAAAHESISKLPVCKLARSGARGKRHDLNQR